MSFLRSIQWYHSQADPILADGTRVAYSLTFKRRGIYLQVQPKVPQNWWAVMSYKKQILVVTISCS